MIRSELIFKNKKANAIIDSIFVIVGLVVFAIIIGLGYFIFGETNTELQADADLSAESKDLMTTQYDTYPQLFDGIFIFTLVGLWIMVIIFSFMIDTHPIFLVLSIILLVAVLIISAILANTSVAVLEDSSFGTGSTNFPMMMFILKHMVETIMAIAFSILIALFAKSRLN